MQLAPPTPLDIAYELLASAALGGGSPVVVDGGGALNPYRLVEAARKHGAQRPELVLRRIWVARAFTAYQELRLLLRLAQRLGRGERAWLLNPLFPFTDPDLPGVDRPWLFHRLLSGLKYLDATGRGVTVFQGGGPYTHPIFHNILVRRLPWSMEASGGLIGGSHGQERAAVLSRHRPAGRSVRVIPPRAAAGGQGAA